jgi:hypothetical protein
VRLYHGSDLRSIQALLAGGELDAEIARTHHLNGAPGFYMTTERNDAEYFALRRTVGGIVAIDIDQDAIEQLLRHGASLQPIPETPMSASFDGDELYIPARLFDLFNSMRKEGRIHVVVG